MNTKSIRLLFLTLLTILIFNSNAVSIKEISEYSVKNFGAIGDGKTDDTLAIQRAIDTAYIEKGEVVIFPKGVYLVDPVKSIIVKNNLNLKFEKGAVLQSLPTQSAHYQMIRIHDSKNVKITGEPTIIGDRNIHTGTGGEWGFGISLRGSEDIYIENVKISHCWGDGIYIGSTPSKDYNENIEIINPVLTNNRRQGISIISAKNLLIKDALITGTNGTNPESGIDIEPNLVTERLEEIKIINLSTANNKGSGLQIYLKYLKNNIRPVEIFVDSTKNILEGIAVKELTNVRGTINVEGYYHLSETEIVAKPIANSLTDRSTTIVGKAVNNTTVTAKVEGKVIGSAKSNAEGAYSISIPRQTVGKLISLIAEDQYKNLSKETVVVVSKFIGVQPERIAGSNRYETAVAISKKSWSNADTIVLATGEDFPDALTGGPLAYKEKAPILLTRTKSLNQETEAEIMRLKAEKVIILGSELAVSAEIESALKKKGLAVERVGGSNRYATAALIAKRLNSTKAIIGYGRNFPDILSVSPYAAKNRIPILLTRTDRVPEETKNALKGKTKTLVIGSTGVIDQSVLSELPAPTRFGGSNRFETSKAVIQGLPLGTETGFIATGRNFPDALAGSPLAALKNAPVLLVEELKVPDAYQSILKNYQAYTILGSNGAVAEEVENVLYHSLTE